MSIIIVVSLLKGVIEEGMKQRKERAVEISQSRVSGGLQWSASGGVG